MSAQETQHIPLKLKEASSTKDDDDDDSTSISLFSTKQFNLNPSARNTLLVLKFSDLLNPKHSHLVAVVVLWNTPCQGENENHYTNENGLHHWVKKKWFWSMFWALEAKGAWNQVSKHHGGESSHFSYLEKTAFFFSRFSIFTPKSRVYFLVLSQETNTMGIYTENEEQKEENGKGFFFTWA